MAASKNITKSPKLSYMNRSKKRTKRDLERRKFKLWRIPLQKR